MNWCKISHYSNSIEQIINKYPNKIIKTNVCLNKNLTVDLIVKLENIQNNDCLRIANINHNLNLFSKRK